MHYIYGRNSWSTPERGQENCFLQANGLGGFSSQTVLGSSARNDHALFMACTHSPNYRYNLILGLKESVSLCEDDGTTLKYNISSRERSTEDGYKYLELFEYESYPTWTYRTADFLLVKSSTLVPGENTLALHYELTPFTGKKYTLNVTPLLEFVKKGAVLSTEQSFTHTDSSVISNGLEMYVSSSCPAEFYETEYDDTLYFSYDECDGRNPSGVCAHNHTFHFSTDCSADTYSFDIIYSLDSKAVTRTSAELFELTRSSYQKEVAQAGFNVPLCDQLVHSACQFISRRKSTNGYTLLAGFPFFEDWGRDTMISLYGCCIATRQFETAKSILQTFASYCKNGLMPNLFPEGTSEPLYNTVDAALLFINAVHEYTFASGDKEFIHNIFPVMRSIVDNYIKGTDFDIHMDVDGLISAGSGFDQVTWMDVRINDVLPTPRHGKPVEINAYWYNALCIMNKYADNTEASRIIAEIGGNKYTYLSLAEYVKKNFLDKFWNAESSCLYDVLSSDKKDIRHNSQIRCNQIWAVSLPFTMLSEEQTCQILETVRHHLLTPYGLRTLSPSDDEFHPYYGGEQFNRDMAYHQGTVWVFPLGAYYLAYLKLHKYSDDAVKDVLGDLSQLAPALSEGCIGTLPEIYDGLYPVSSKGCFSQAWSVAEILKVFDHIRLNTSCQLFDYFSKIY